MRRGAPLLIQRHILGELAFNVVLSLTAITAIFFVGMVIQTLYRYPKLPVTAILTLVPYFLPYAITFTLPLTGLIASVQTYGRMAADNEILALQTAGVHLYPVVVPALFLGVLLSGVSLFLNGEVVPRCLRMRKHITQSSLDQVLVKLKTGEHTIPIRNHVLTFTVNGNGTYSDILIVEPSGKGGSRKIMAERGDISVNHERETLVFHLRNGHVESQGDAGDAKGGAKSRTFNHGSFDYLPMEIDLSGQQASVRGPLKECTLEDISYRLGREDLAARRPAMRTEYHKRISISFAAVIFALVGTPIGILFRRGGFHTAYFLSLLLAIVVYYPLLLLCEAISSEGTVPAALGMWTPNGIVGGIGILLLWHIFTR